jgi:hypothetical protein
MGTRGYIVIKYHNKYYKIYNHYDSYPSSFGKKVIDILKKLKKENKLEQSEKCLNTIIQCFDGSVEHGDQELDLMIEWVYTINLNVMTLTIKGDNGEYITEYNISDIDDNWLNDFNC